MMDPDNALPRIEVCDWAQAMPSARRVREAVFVVEQQVPIELEWDEWDAQCDHALAFSAANEPVGTARLLPDGHLGRMAVLVPWRGRGIGRALAGALLARARARGFPRIELHAQTHAAGFYRKLGFREFGEEFEEAGIPHIAMGLDLTPRRVMPSAQAAEKR